MLIQPGWLESLAYASSQYNQIAATNWATHKYIEYTDDNNGSCITKTTKDSSNSVVEAVQYDYNLQNKLEKVTTDPISGSTVSVTEYTYNDEGIRVQAVSYDMPRGGGTHTNETTINYLIDAYNHTGYAQVFEEYDGVNRTYTIGDDVISQYDGTSVGHFLYDGLGSVRHLTNGSGNVVADHVFNYDAYGVLLGYTGTPQTNLRYTGEYYDTALKQYNLRARYYDPLNGRFNQTDPFPGNNQDPQSLHKYLYCHANPVNGIDPSGNEFSLLSITGTMANIASTFMRYYPVLRIGLVIADILTAANIVLKAITQGISSVTAGEWTQLALITTTVFIGGKIARQVAKSLISRALGVPAEILQSFKGFSAFVKSKGIILWIDDAIKYTEDGKQAIGEFDLIDKVIYTEPIIKLHRGGHNISTLIHEFVHYNQWKYFVGGTRHDWLNFISIPKYERYLEHVAYFVRDVFLK